MPILAYRDSTVGGDSSFGVSSIVATVPTTVAGDLQYIWATAGDLAPAPAPTIATPSGWTASGVSGTLTLAGGVLNSRIHLFTKIATNADADVTLNAGTNAAMGYVRASYSNPDSVSPFGQVTFGQGGPSTSAVLSAMTTTENQALLSGFISQSAAQLCTPPSGMTEREDSSASGIAMADVIQATAGTTGTKTFTLPTSVDYIWGFAEFHSAFVHTSTGALVGPGSTIAGSANRTRAHTSSGVLTGQGSTVAGSANRTRAHASTGSLTGQGSQVVGAAARTRGHASSGALTGQGSEVAGSAARTRAHGASGALVGPGSEIVGSADHQGAAGTHDATGTLVGQGSIVTGSAARLRAFGSSGALVGQGSVVSGAAARVGAAVSHNASGVMVGQGSALTGAAVNGTPSDGPFGGGFFPQALRRRLFEEEMREKLKEHPPQVADVIENTVIESIDRPKKPTQKELRQAFEQENIPYREAYRKAVVSMVQEMRQREEDDEEEEAIALAVASLI